MRRFPCSGVASGGGSKIAAVGIMAGKFDTSPPSPEPKVGATQSGEGVERIRLCPIYYVCIIYLVQGRNATLYVLAYFSLGARLISFYPIPDMPWSVFDSAKKPPSSLRPSPPSKYMGQFD